MEDVKIEFLTVHLKNYTSILVIITYNETFMLILILTYTTTIHCGILHSCLNDYVATCK